MNIPTPSPWCAEGDEIVDPDGEALTVVACVTDGNAEGNVAAIAGLPKGLQVMAAARGQPQDLAAYTNRARHPRSRESRRLCQEPAEVVARIEDYVLDVLDLLSETPTN